MKVLVTGGAGFIGSFLVDALVQRGHAVTIYDKLDPQVHGGRVPEHLNATARFVQADVCDREKLEPEACSADVIFHKAAAVGVGQSQYDIRRYVADNVLGTATLLDILAKSRHHVKKLIVAASMSSYGEGAYQCPRCGPFRPVGRLPEDLETQTWEPRCPRCGHPGKTVPLDEDAQLQCASVYALTKRDQEDLVLNFGRTYRVACTSLRYFNVYGPRQALSNPYTGVCAIFISRLKNNQPPVIYEDGLQTRDFVSVHDIVRANLLAMESDVASGKCYNVGIGQPLSILQIARTLAHLLGKEIEPKVTNRFRPGDIRHCVADITRIRGDLDYEPQVSFEDGMRELTAWATGQQAEDRFDQALDQMRQLGLIA